MHYLRKNTPPLTFSFESQNEVAVKVFPNPISVGENINFTITSETDEHLYISLMDMKGSVVNQLEYNAREGKNSFTFSTFGLKAGVYILKARGNSFLSTTPQKIIIK